MKKFEWNGGEVKPTLTFRDRKVFPLYFYESTEQERRRDTASDMIIALFLFFTYLTGV